MVYIYFQKKSFSFIRLAMVGLLFPVFLLFGCSEKKSEENKITGQWLYNPAYCQNKISSSGTFSITIGHEDKLNANNLFNLSKLKIEQIDIERAKQLSESAKSYLKNCEIEKDSFSSGQYFKIRKHLEVVEFLYIESMDKLFVYYKSQPNKPHLMIRYNKDYIINTPIEAANSKTAN